MCCSHVGTDLGFGRESLADAIRQSEQGGEEGGPTFDWDVAVVLGDHSGGQTTPTDEEGREIVRQFGVSARHRREDFYTVIGNHDAPIEEDAPLQWWARKWIDPTGETPEHSEVNADRMPHAVDGTWERYTFAVGNIRFLMMSDRNDFPPPVGRRGASHGGYPSGAVTSETFDWWKAIPGVERGLGVGVDSPSHAEGDYRRLRPVGGTRAGRPGQLDVGLPRLFRRRRAGRFVLPIFPGRQAGCAGVRGNGG